MFKSINTMSLALKTLELENFKCFKEKTQINFEKLTILTGANSSGKSSVLHAILGALQSKDFPFLFSTNGKYINMGDFKEISNAHDPTNLIRIKFTFKDNIDKEVLHVNTEWETNKNNGLPVLNTLLFERPSATFNLKKSTKSTHYNLSFSYEHTKDVELKPLDKEMDDFQMEQLIKTTEKVRELNAKNKEKQKQTDEKKYIERLQKYISSRYEDFFRSGIKVSNLEKIEEVAKRYSHMMFNRVPGILNGMFNDFDQNINFISSFRLYPDRTYLEKSIDALKVGTFGQGYLDQIVLWKNNNPEKIKELISIMSELKLFYSIDVGRLGGGRYEIVLKTKKNGVKSSITDVGFGISQFLPIIVADLQLRDNSTLFVSQPEIHLHPNSQADFGDYLAKQIKEKKKNYIIETHSEYLLNRIRLAIVKGTLKADDLAVYYLENDNDKSTIHHLKFGSKGEIEGAPESFFDTYLMDIKNIAINSL